MIRIAVLLGNQPRHLALLKFLQEEGLLVGAIVEERPKYSLDLTAIGSLLLPLALRHFELRDQAEEFFFGEAVGQDYPALTLEAGHIEAAETEVFLDSVNPDLVLIWGTSLISDRFMRSIGVPFWNIHAGLSPQYRGSATLFWPSFFLEPQMSGMTLHVPISRIDAGPIIHQVGARLVSGDGLQTHAARTVHDSLKEIVGLLKNVGKNEIPEGIVQRKSGKLFLESDWRPEHLTQIYNSYNDQIVDLVIDGQIKGREPQLVSALEIC